MTEVGERFQKIPVLLFQDDFVDFDVAHSATKAAAQPPQPQRSQPARGSRRIVPCPRQGLIMSTSST
jgi:hypothetical protein